MKKRKGFNEFYEGYLELHQNKYNRYLHAAGTIISLALLTYGILTLNVIIILLSVIVVYPFAWAGHLYIEKNKPAAWSNPLYSRLSDWRMLYEMLSGNLKE